MILFITPALVFIAFYFGVDAFAIGNSKIEGLTPEGERWAYEFSEINSATSKKISLDAFDSKKLIYANHEFIVTKSLTYLGVGRYKTSLFFYNAKSLILEAIISVPNNVCSVDYSPKRKQFVLMTIGREGDPGVKWPDDTGQAIVLADLNKKTIERSPIWKKGTNLYDFGGPDLDPKWYGNSVVLNSLKLTGVNASYFTDIESQNSLVINKFSSSVFSDIEFKMSNRNGKQLEDQRKQWIANSAIGYVFDDAELQTKSSGNSFSIVGDDSPYFALSRKIENPLKFTMVFSQSPGTISEVNLHSLSNRILNNNYDSLDGLGVFKDGSFYARSADSVHIYPNLNSVLQKSIPNTDHEAIASLGA